MELCQEVPETPSNIKGVYRRGCTGYEVSERLHRSREGVILHLGWTGKQFRPTGISTRTVCPLSSLKNLKVSIHYSSEVELREPYERKTLWGGVLGTVRHSWGSVHLPNVTVTIAIRVDFRTVSRCWWSVHSIGRTYKSGIHRDNSTLIWRTLWVVLWTGCLGSIEGLVPYCY